VYGITVSAEIGQDTYSSMLAAKEGRIRASLVLGGNLWGSNPDLTFAGSALKNIPFTVFMSTKLNPGHVHGRGRTTVILPVLARDEETQATTQESMFNFVRLSEGGTPAVEGEMRSEVAIVSDLADRILPEGKFDWSVLRSHQRLREEIAKTVPGYEAIADIEKSRDEFQIKGRTFHEPEFATKDGRAHFHVTPLPEPFVDAEAGEFRLMTIRSEGQFNTVVYEEEDLYRGNTTRDVVMLSQEDADRLSLAEGDGVLVRTSVGEMRVKAAIVDIRPGNLAMYYPEANLIVPRRLDPVSKTPAFKGVAARLQPV
jgi:anaerobic selenocysteine-containing dehydrogenase